MELAKYKACICEGAAENTIMDMRFFHTGFYFGVYPVEA